MLLYFIWEFLTDIWNDITISISDSKYYKLKELQRRKFYQSVTADDLNGLSDMELFAALWHQLGVELRMVQITSVSELEAFNQVQKAYWVANAYEQRNYRGGILEYFFSKYRYTAQYLSVALNLIGAVDHLRLFQDFIERNGIDLRDISEFELKGLKRKEKVRRLEELRRKYGAEDFDNEYRTLEPIENYLIAYVRKNTDTILERSETVVENNVRKRSKH